MAPTPQPVTPAQAARLHEAFDLLLRKEHDKAHAIAREIIAQVPRSPDAHHMLALVLRAKQQLQEAEQSLIFASELAPQNPHIHSNLGGLLLAVRRPAEARKAFEKAVAADPQFDLGWANLGVCALETGDVATALSALDKAIAINPRAAGHWSVKGAALQAAGDFDGAVQAFGRALELNPADIKSWTNIATAFRVSGKPVLALEHLRRAQQLGHGDPAMLDLLAGVLVDLGRLGEAYAELEKLLINAPAYAPTYDTRAHILWEYGDHVAPGRDPLSDFRIAADAQPQNEQLQFQFIRFLLQARNSEEALRRARRFQVGTANPSFALAEANALTQMEALDEARPIFERLHASAIATDTALLNAYAHFLLRTRDPERAAALAMKVIEKEPHSQEAWCHLSTAWCLMGDEREHWLCDYERLIDIVEIEPPPGYADCESFAAALRGALEPIHLARREPVNQSLRGGSQTPGRLFGREDAVIDAAEKAIKRAVERRVATLPTDETHPFLSRTRRSVMFVGSWSVKLWTSGRHANHFHPEGWMSSALYVALPPSVRAPTSGADPRAGWIHFGQPQTELKLDLEPRRYIQPKVGHVALFPSYMWHGTVPFEDKDPRMTIAFDMQPID